MLLCISTTTSNANNNCDFQITVIDGKTNQELKVYEVKRMGETEKDYFKSESKHPTVRFVFLNEQTYEVEVSKKDYRPSVFFLDCFAVADQDTIKLRVPIWKESSDGKESFLELDKTTGKFKKINYNPNLERRIPNSNKRILKKDESLSVYYGKQLYIDKPKPVVNSEGKEIRGTVKVKILIDKYGKVTEAKAVSGPKKLRNTAVESALKSIFEPTKIGDKPIEAAREIVYNF